MIHDPIADMLTRIRNAIAREHKFVQVSYSKLNHNILKVLKDSGFIEKSLIDKDTRVIRVYLKYTEDRSPIIRNIKRESTPGRRRYVGVNNLPVIRGGLGKSIISTSRGIMSTDKAKKERLGGELICSVY